MGFIYKPKTSISEFLEHFEDKLVRALLLCDYVLTLGDFYINLLRSDRAGVIKYQSVIESYGFSQIVEVPSRVCAESVSLIDHLLDFFFTFLENGNKLWSVLSQSLVALRA